MVELATGREITPIELSVATRNRGMPLEAMRDDVTPVGLHYLLVHFDIPALDAASWRLRIAGEVGRELELTLDEIRALPAVTMPVTMECAGNGRARLEPRPMTQPWLEEAVATAEWTGTSLSGVLERAGIAPEAIEVVFTGADHGIEGGEELDYARSLPIAEAMRPEVLLAYEMNGRPLEPQHGFPLRLLVPGWYGMTSVKWLSSIVAVSEPFRGFHQAVAYRYQQSEEDPGEPVTRIRPRALMIPPGFPGFPERRRHVDAGRVTIEGRAWSGAGPIVRVELGVDGEWFEADLAEPAGQWAWRRWSCEWQATPGDHVLSCRATDATGDAQPVEQPWNLQGVGNNLIQRVEVTVR
ncbi:MAG TPA: sulfite oxidase [Solirubrobacterales bacterium]|nr:sulfite oxidase [Solirubrobacterales bacterium]